MKISTSFLLLLLLTISTSLHACRWCAFERAKTVVTTELVEHDDGSSLFVSLDPSIHPVILSDFPQGNCSEGQDEREHDEADDPFALECIELSYPKANTICDIYFPEMCPAALDCSFRAIVDLLSKREWYYFQDAADRFRWGANE